LEIEAMVGLEISQFVGNAQLGIIQRHVANQASQAHKCSAKDALVLSSDVWLCQPRSAGLSQSHLTLFRRKTVQNGLYIPNAATMSSSPVMLLFGAGPRLGAAIAAKFAASGYQVATVSRKGTGGKTSEGYLSLSADLTHPESIPGVFAAVQKEFKAPPSVVVYNAGFYASPPDANNLFTLPLDKFRSDLSGNVLTPFAAVQEAAKGWATLPKGAKKTFIYTGNGYNDLKVKETYAGSLGAGKSATASWIATADLGNPLDGAR
jgi:hypothetical protein